MALNQQTTPAETLPVQTVPVVGEGAPPTVVEETPPRTEQVLSRRGMEAARVEEEKRVLAEALETFQGWNDTERAIALARVKEDHDLNIAWSRSLDTKVPTLLAVSGAIITAIFALLVYPDLLKTHSLLTNVVLVSAFLPLLIAVAKAVAVVSPTLRIRATLFEEQHKTADDTVSNMFYGAIAKHKSLSAYVAAAIPALKDDTERMRDFLQQTYINGKICQQKNDELVVSARWILTALCILLLWLAMFAYEINNGKIISG